MTELNRRDVLRAASLSVAAAGCVAPTAPEETTRTTTTTETGADDAGEWPMFQLDARNTGCHPETAAPAEDIGQRWRRTLPSDIWGGPVVSNGTAYLGCHDHRVYALDTETGEEEWNFETGDRVYGTPGVVGGTVYFASADGNVYAVEADSGKEEWRYGTEGLNISSPTIVDGTVYVGSHCHRFQCNYDYDVPNHGYGFVYALDADSGDLEWRYRTGEDVIPKPAVYEGTVYAGSGDSRIHAIDEATGEAEWTAPTSGPILSSPTIADGTLYTATNSGDVYAIDTDSPTVEWTFETEAPYISASPSICDDVVYIGLPGIPADIQGQSVPEPRGVMFALDAATGDVNWSYPTLALEIGSTPAIADGVLWFGCHSNDGSYGGVYCLGLDGGLRWKLEVGGEGVGISPAVVDGAVYFGTGRGVMYALDEASTTEPGQ